MNETIEKLERLDQQLFLFLNGLHTPWLDTLMYWISLKYTWFPFYLLLIVWLSWQYKWPGFLMLLTMVAALGLGDLVTSGFMKPFFARPRPCHEPLLQGMVHVVSGCGGRFGFASAHAATTFALANSIWLLLRYWSRWWGLTFVWAGLVAYSRVYLGVHYPADIIIGALIGILIGWLMVHLHLWLSRRLSGKPLSSRYLPR
jgi:undecaprenyl-diphosphatase